MDTELRPAVNDFFVLPLHTPARGQRAARESARQACDGPEQRAAEVTSRPTNHVRQQPLRLLHGADHATERGVSL